MNVSQFQHIQRLLLKENFKKKTEHSVYKETCEKLALELNEVKKQTTEEITKTRFNQANEFAKSERIHTKEIL